MSPADNRAHFGPRFMAIAVLISCTASCRTEQSAAPLCGGLGRDLDGLAAVATADLAHRVDDRIAKARSCTDAAAAIRGSSVAHQLARARLADDQPAAAIHELTAVLHPAIAVRRAELFDRLGRPHDALGALAPALVADTQAATQYRLLAVSIAAKAGAHADLARLIAAAPLTERPQLAHRAAADTAEASLAGLAAQAVPELVAAAGDRLEELNGPAAARGARERCVELEPDIAEHWDALGRARIAAGAIDEALAAWDRAIAIAPAQPTFRTMPIRALVIAGEPARARQRAVELAQSARASGDVDLLVTASAGAAAAADAALAVALARDARSRRASDGRLAFLVGQRLAEAGDRHGAAAEYADLLVCGAHGKPWHRHEVGARLLALGDPAIVDAALARKRSCTPVDPADLDTYVGRLRAPAERP